MYAQLTRGSCACYIYCMAAMELNNIRRIIYEDQEYYPAAEVF